MTTQRKTSRNSLTIPYFQPKLWGWDNIEKMNRHEIEHFLYHHCGQTIGWLANTINVPGLSNPKTKLLGLARLAAVKMVTAASWEMYMVNINGSIRPIAELEKYAKGLELISGEHLVRWLHEETAETGVDPWIMQMVMDALSKQGVLNETA